MTFSLSTIRLDGAPTPVLTLDGRHYRITDSPPKPWPPTRPAG